MGKFPQKLQEKLKRRVHENALRDLTDKRGLVDFTSNDYLGLAREKSITARTNVLLKEFGEEQCGSTGSRLLSGNNSLNVALEKYLADYYQSDTALVFNSGYDANLGFFSSVPQRGDVILYDELCHASIRDGIRMSHAKSYKFKHNDLVDLGSFIKRFETKVNSEIYVVTESVFSMDGDSPNLTALVDLCDKRNIYLIVDEAHAVGVFQKGLLSQLGLKDKVFARIATFGKALGVHGAVVLGSEKLKEFLINFCRSFIYTTALPPHTLAAIWASHEFLDSQSGQERVKMLQQNIAHFKSGVEKKGLTSYFCSNRSAIQVCTIGGNEKVKTLSKNLEEEGFDVRPILSPTVPKGQERLRFCLHAYNTQQEIDSVLGGVKRFLIS